MEQIQEFENEARNDLIEGRNAVMEALRAGRTIDKIFIAKGDVDKTLALVRASAAVQVDGHVVVGQVCIVDAVRVHLLFCRPFTALLVDFVQARGKLLGSGIAHGDLGIADLDRRVERVELAF